MMILLLDQTPVETVISEAVHVLAQGGMVVYPTETVYGIGVDATNQVAVDRLLRYKTRREGKPMSVAVADSVMAEQYVEVNASARNLYENFLPGPLTVVSVSKNVVAHGVASESGTLGIRIPDYSLVIEIVKGLGRAITSTSANASYQKRPYSVQDIFENISEKQRNLIDLVIDAGTLPKRDPSTVVDTTLHQEVVVRQGSLRLHEIMKRKTSLSEETTEIGKELMRLYEQYLGYKSVVFALQGELGAGKTQMAKGIAEILGVSERVDSPTFIIEKEYAVHGATGSYVEQRRPHLYHIDTWRLQNSSELVEMGFVEKVQQGNVFVVEWADRVQDLLTQVQDDAIVIWVYLEYGDELTKRIITVSTSKN